MISSLVAVKNIGIDNHSVIRILHLIQGKKTLSYCLSTDQKLVRVRPQVFHSLISSHQYYSTWDSRIKGNRRKESER